MATEYPDGIVIGYVNTYLNVKAESDYCCASANAAKVVLLVLENSRPTQPLLFLPDVYLGFYAAKLLEQQKQSVDRLWLMMGACPVRDRIRPYHVGYETYRETMLKKPYADAAPMKLLVEVIAETNPKAKGINLAALIDSSFVERLDRDGVLDK